MHSFLTRKKVKRVRELFEVNAERIDRLQGYKMKLSWGNMSRMDEWDMRRLLDQIEDDQEVIAKLLKELE